jgi:dolichyl-phosphate beta-glucosyltransferase
MKLVSLIIPAYNEAERIRATVSEALDYFDGRGIDCEVIVSADGNDGTREAARALAEKRPQIKVIGQPERRGKGRGIREAVRLASGDVIGFTDADNKTPIGDFDKIEQRLRDGDDMVIGSRALSGSRIERAQPFYRRLGSRGFGLCMHACVGLYGIVDTQCGFKFFRGDVARELFRLQQIDGYMFDVEILYLAEQLGYRIAEVPVRWRDDGDSRLQLLVGNIRNLRDIASIRWRHRDVVATAPAEPQNARAALPKSPPLKFPHERRVRNRSCRLHR